MWSFKHKTRVWTVDWVSTPENRLSAVLAGKPSCAYEWFRMWVTQQNTASSLSRAGTRTHAHLQRSTSLHCMHACARQVCNSAADSPCCVRHTCLHITSAGTQHEQPQRFTVKQEAQGETEGTTYKMLKSFSKIIWMWEFYKRLELAALRWVALHVQHDINTTLAPCPGSTLLHWDSDQVSTYKTLEESVRLKCGRFFSVCSGWTLSSHKSVPKRKWRRLSKLKDILWGGISLKSDLISCWVYSKPWMGPQYQSLILNWIQPIA